MEFLPKHIVVPMDLSEPSRSALEAAKQLAKRCGARLDLVYLTSFQVPLAGATPEGILVPTPELLEETDEYRKWRKEGIKRAMAGFPMSRVRVHTGYGWPTGALLKIAKGNGSKWIVMGTHGYAGLERALFGSLAEGIVSHADVPVLTMHRQKALRGVSKVLIPFNMKAYAEKALLYGLKVAQKFKAKTCVMYVASEGEDLRSAEQKMRSCLKTALKGGPSRGLAIVVRHGDSRHEILRFADRGKFDLIVLSAHRRPFWRDYVIGSTAERVLRHSEVPVLSIPSGKPRKTPDGKKASQIAWVTNKIY